MTRLLIRGGVLVDGTGARSRTVDLIVDGERISEVLTPGSDVEQYDSLIEANGLIICPGFIDIHSHGDLVFALPPDAQRELMAGRIGQGIQVQVAVARANLGLSQKAHTV